MTTTKKFASILLGAALLLALGAARSTAANLAGHVAGQPAATLLLPYFEVNLATGADDDTVFTVNNASATAVLAHVVVWSDLAVPVLAFNLYLTGFDVQATSMRDLLAGNIPATASDGQDWTDTISPQGPFSQDINFASCWGMLPVPKLGAGYVRHLKNSLTGKFSSYLGGCAGRDRGDLVARGFVTVDTVNNCTLRVPGDPGYFVDGGFGDATVQNVLWGEFYYFGPSTAAKPSRAGAAMVAIRADPTDPQNGAGEYTFYGREVAFTGADDRQALGSTFAARHLRSPQLATGAKLVVWRDPKVKQAPFACGSYPAWYEAGLDMEELVSFDERENPVQLTTLKAFPAVTQKVGVAALGTPYKSGWLYMDFDAPLVTTVPTEDPVAGQAWVFVIEDAAAGYSAAHPATMLQSATETTRQQLLP